MNYFYLAHSVMSLKCLKGLIENNYSPDFVIIHKYRDREILAEDFYNPVIDFCRFNKIELSETECINHLTDKLKYYDVGICVGFMDILKKDVFSIPKFGILNLHCGKLPEYRGRAPISRSIMDGKEFLTVTVHKIDEGVDSGDICEEYNIEITNEDDVNTLYRKCSDVSSELIIKCLKDLGEDKLVFQKQSSDLLPNKIVNNEERKINWEEISVINFNKIRALTIPYPCAYSFFQDNKYYFIKAELLNYENRPILQPGTISKISNNSMEVISGNGILGILDIMDENFIEINFNEHFKVGDKFE